MPTPKLAHLPALLFPRRASAERKALARLRAEGKIRKIGPRLYASVPLSEVAAAVRGSWSTIVSTLFPNALLSHRTAFEYKPSPAGEIFLTSSTNRDISYPGLKIRFLRGPGPLDDDAKFLSMRASSQPRLLLENLSTTRGGLKSKVVPVEEVEKRLERILAAGGESALNELRDHARRVSTRLGWRREFRKLDGMIGALLRTKPAGKLAAPAARARAAGQPYDTACLERLQLLFGELRGRPLAALRDRFEAPDHFTNKAFFESYFSNYIEGTRFEIDAAEEIVFDGKIPESRPKDAHDIAGTFRIVSDPVEMRKAPTTFDGFRETLVSRHRILMERRPDAAPGLFKERPNRAGDSVFTHPALVAGTLKKGLELHTDLPPGLARAVFVMFLVADTHPFVDGNGRIARIMMNAELVADGLTTIIIPTVYREDYLLTLRALTRRHRPGPLVDMLARAQRFSHMEFSPYPRILKELQRRNWFREPDGARIID